MTRTPASTSLRIVLAFALSACASPAASVEAALIEPADTCRMSGAGLLSGSGDSFTFDVTAGTLRHDVPGMTGGTFVADPGALGNCARGARGFEAEMEGTGSWNGSPGHRFVMHAVNIPASAATPAAGLSLDTYFLAVSAPSGATVFTRGGFVSAALTSTNQVLPGGTSCTITGTGTSAAGDSVTIAASSTSSTPTSGTLDMLSAPGGGRRLRLAGEPTFVLCDVSGTADVFGTASINGVSGYTFRLHVLDRDAQTPGDPEGDFTRLAVFDALGTLTFVTDGDLASGDFTVTSL